MNRPGQSCPIEYHYDAREFRRATTSRAETAYVVGGLYGNLEALHEILRMQESEAKHGIHVDLVFNGDYNWFNTDIESFREVNQLALESISIRGNVEAELSAPTDAGCGCNYPDYVNAEYVARSNAIMRRLRDTAAQAPELREALGRLPYFRVLEVGECRIGIVHGDAETLSGWAFAAERLSPIGTCCSGDEADVELTPLQTIERYFRDSGVHAFASTHTCLAHAHDYRVDGSDRLIINNGAAGLPNFANTGFGLITRVSTDVRIPPDSLYGISVHGVRFDAVPVHFDTTAWHRRFFANWPLGSPAYEAYYRRIVKGPEFGLRYAIGGRVQRTNF